MEKVDSVTVAEWRLLGEVRCHVCKKDIKKDMVRYWTSLILNTIPKEDENYWIIHYEEFPDTCTQCASKELIERNQQSIEECGEEINTKKVVISYDANPLWRRK